MQGFAGVEYVSLGLNSYCHWQLGWLDQILHKNKANVKAVKVNDLD